MQNITTGRVLALFSTLTLLVSLSFKVAQASIVYTYTGNNYNSIVGTEYDTSMNLSGWLILDTALGANMALSQIDNFDILSLSFFDGVHTRTLANSTESVSLGTDASGNINEWIILLRGSEGALLNAIDSASPGSGHGPGDYVRLTPSIVATPIHSGLSSTGVAAEIWSINPVPIPAALPLFGSALGLMGFAGWKRKKAA